MNELRGLHPVYVLEENELRTVGTYSRFFFIFLDDILVKVIL